MPSTFTHLPYRPCVGIMLLNAEDKVFVGKRIDQTSEAWQMPQGGIDEGESPENCAQRELEEETGVTDAAILAQTSEWLSYDLPDELIPQLWGGRYRGQTQLWFAMRLNGEDGQININTREPEFSDWQWVRMDELSGLIVPFKQELYARVIEEFRHLVE